jgi:hypothetical protein
MTALVLTQTVLQQGDGIPGAGFWIVWLAVIILVIGGVWKTFTKADQPGWAALIPFYNFYIMLKIGDNEWWWLLALFVPIVNFYAMYKIFAGVSKAFGHGVGFALGLWFLSVVFWPYLGFSDTTYQGTPG